MCNNSVIFKYELVGMLSTIELPSESRVLSVQKQYDSICMWVEVDITKPKVVRKFRLIGTGHYFDFTRMSYVGTVQDGSLVWHIYEQG